MKGSPCVARIFFLQFVITTPTVAEGDCYMFSLCNWQESQQGCIVDCRHNYYKDVPENVPPKTWSLDLSENEISSIKEGSFSNLTILEILDLTDNLIETVENKSFCHQQSLKNLNISKNNLDDISDGSFTYLVNLKALNLSGNQLKELHVSDLKRNTKLDSLDLSINAFSTPQTYATKHLQHLRYLFLSHNQIKEINDGIFKYFLGLEILNLSENMIKELGRGAFSELTRLQKLYLWQNRIEVINDHTFVDLMSLEELHLGLNRIRYLSENVFHTLRNVELLSLGQNRLQKLPRKLFHSLSKLKQLDLSGNQIQEILEGTFDNLDNLQNLDISHNQLENINKSSFRALNSLQNLDLSNNQVGNIDESSFMTLNGLEKLILSQNTLSKLPRNLFCRLANLNHLDISHNALSHLHEDTFDGLSNLKQLIITGNHVTDLSKNIFYSLENLDELYLDYNHIDAISSDVLRHVKYVTILDFSGNKVVNLRGGLFKHSYNLQILYINDNKLNEIGDGTFDTLFPLNELELSSNRILKFEKHLFWPLGELCRLDLSGNQISTIWKDSFYNLSNLEILKLNGNKLKSLHRDTFKNLRNLSSIYLNDNRILSIKEGTFVNLPNLYEIHLMGNYLDELERGSIHSVPYLQSIDLSINRLQNGRVDGFFSNFTLSYLDLSHNNLSVVTKDLLHIQEEAYCYFLSMANNGIASLPGDLFSLVSLFGVLDILGNEISELPALVFISAKLPQELNTLLLHRNKLTFIPKDAFEGLYYLKSLSLFHNRIKALDDGAFSKTGVMYIYLFGNDLSTLSNTSLNNGNITEIHLYGNSALSLYRSGFTGVNSNTILYVGCDSVEEIERTMTVLTCVTPNYVPTLEIGDDVVISLQNEGFTCDKSDKYIHSYFSECKPCPRGYYGTDNIRCMPCPAGGFYQNEIGATPNVLGEIACKQCPKGMFVNHTGATSIQECKICPDGTNKRQYAGFRACPCLDNFARFDRFGPCFLCPDEGYNCSGSDYVSLNPGFFWSWNFSSANITGYKRFIDNLKNETRFGSNASSDTKYSFEIPGVFKCPRFKSCSNAPGAVEVTCAKGYRGWLCSKCDRGFFGVMESCFECPSYVYLVIEALFGLVIVSGIIFVAGKQFKLKNIEGRRRSVFDIIISRSKIALGFYQIIGEFFISFHEINWVGNVYVVGEIFSFLEMNILRLFVKPRCLNVNLAINPKSEFIVSMVFLLLTTLIPYAVLKLKQAYFKYRHPSLEGSGIALIYYRNLKEKIIGGVVVLLYLSYPPICASIFRLYPKACQTFCLDINNAHCIQLLRSDYDINCKEITLYHISAYIATIAYVIAFPTLLFFLLRKYAYIGVLARKKPNTSNSSIHENREENLTSDENNTSSWMSFFCENYKPQYWFWEIIELARKVTQTLLIILLGWENKLTVLLSIGISVSFLILHARYLPMKSKFEQGVQMFSLLAIFINVLVAAMKVPVTQNGTLSAALTLLNVAVLAVIVGEAALGLIHHLRQTRLVQTLLTFLINMKRGIVNRL